MNIEKIMKKRMAQILVPLILVSATTSFTFANSFADTPTDELLSICFAAYPDGTLRPDEPITRAEAAAMICQFLVNAPEDTLSYECEHPFGDVCISEWHYNCLSSLKDTAAVCGYDDGCFHPGKHITRAEFIYFVHSCQKDKGPCDPVPYPEAQEHWALRSIRIGLSRGWIEGFDDETFRPDNHITRADAVGIIAKVLGNSLHTQQHTANAANSGND